MERLKKIISPLFLTFLYVLGFGLYVFTRDPGEEGWGYLAALMICLFSIIPLVLDLVMKAAIKKRNLCLLMQIPIAVIILVLYWKWELLTI